jgi:hypothetical protein
MKITHAMFIGQIIPLLKEYEKHRTFDGNMQNFNHWLADFCGWLGERQTMGKPSLIQRLKSLLKL